MEQPWSNSGDRNHWEIYQRLRLIGEKQAMKNT
jgi:hypothetical protein